ncbi:MAG: hypothetical protein DDT39_01384 [Firmicutes bacterium]|nr:hypothetical protein [candidate division NPL-UPA2 bacterium]
MFTKPNFNPDIFGKDFVQLAAIINNLETVDDILVSSDPHAMLGIRGIGGPTYEIYTSGGESRLGTITWSQILREAYPKFQGNCKSRVSSASRLRTVP